MPLLPLPLGDTDIAGGDLPVSEPGDVLESFPRPQRDATVAPVRDAFCDSFSRGFLAYQNAASYAAAQVDPLRATGSHLTAIAEDRGIPVGPSDTEATLRARIFAVPDIVTPDALESSVNAILAPHTTGVCHLSELNLDGYFIHAGYPCTWDSFVGAEPNYPDRYYSDVPSLLPGGAVPSSGRPRSFAMRIPLLAGASNEFTYASSNPESFVGDGSDTLLSTTFDSYSETNRDTAQTVVGAAGAGVEAAGQSFYGNGAPLASVTLFLSKVGTPTGNAVVRIYAHTGSFGSTGTPTGAALASSAVLDVSTLTTSYALSSFTFSGANRITLSQGVPYFFALEYTAGSFGNGVLVGADSSSPTHAGNLAYYYLGAWIAVSGTDLCFYATTSVGSETSGAIDYFTYPSSQTSDDLYATVVAVVNATKGQGMSWSLLVDDRL